MELLRKKEIVKMIKIIRKKIKMKKAKIRKILSNHNKIIWIITRLAESN